LYAHPFFHAAKRRNCDGDEDSIMLLMDVLLNFSKLYLPESRGGRMDAPLVLTLAIDPKEIDDEVHDMEVVDSYPLELYKKSLEFANPSDVKVATVGNRLGSDRQDRDMLFTHECTSVNDGVIVSAYKKLKTMEDKVINQLKLATKIEAADAQDVASRVLNTHFLRDLYGNLRTFGRQQFRCVDCNSKYRRVPLIGKCTRCGGRILLTIARGSVEKYLGISTRVANQYGLSEYMKQRLELLKREIDEVFENEPTKQVTLDAFM
jgi:DNA polymerase II large subunit